MIYAGDALEVLRGMRAASVQTCITSPPYYGLRDYGVPGQLGLERTPEEYVANLVAVFRQVRRVLKEDGTLWLNLGDSYATGAGKANTPGGGYRGAHGDQAKQKWSGPYQQPNRLPLPGLKPKDLIGVPWLVAFALRADGWYLRCDVIWHKPNPMPSSVRDRPTKAHEYLFLLAKSRRYYYDAAAIAEPRVTTGIHDATGCGYRAPGQRLQNGNRARKHRTPTHRNRRSVWTVGNKASGFAHTATFPRGLVEPCILAGSRRGDVVLDPFAGVGTTGLVAHELGRRFVGIELNPEYVRLAGERLGLAA